MAKKYFCCGMTMDSHFMKGVLTHSCYECRKKHKLTITMNREGFYAMFSYVRKLNYDRSQINQNSWDCGRQDAFAESWINSFDEFISDFPIVKKVMNDASEGYWELLKRKAEDPWAIRSHYMNLKREREDARIDAAQGVA